MKQIIAFCLVLPLGITTSFPSHADHRRGASGSCSATTQAARAACSYEGLDDYFVATGKCANELDRSDRSSCLLEARSELREHDGLCADQAEARDELCDALGEAPYDPSFEPEQFVDPLEIGKSVAANPWFPLIGGRTYVYEGSGETVRVTVTDEVKVIDGVRCLVVRDVVEVDGELEEDTLDWFAQDLDGNVWYCGEATAEYEDGFPTSTDGSFQADVDGARPGLIMKAAPAVGDVYRQEFDLGNAEDAAEVINLAGSAVAPAASCNGTCLVTAEFTSISPDALENKYYAPGIGFVLQINVEDGERLELVEIIEE